MSFMKKRTMERNVLYFMKTIVQQAQHYKRSTSSRMFLREACGHAEHAQRVDKKVAPSRGAT
jgi:hypothetical protein